MRAQSSFAFALLGFALSIDFVAASTRCVPLSHPGNCDLRYATIQAAVDASSAADVVLVAPGTYSEAVTITGSVTLRGAQAGVDARSRSGPETILSHPLGPLTLVDCDNTVVVDGFTLSGAIDPGGSWGGVWITLGGCGSDGTFRLENNVIRDSIAGMYFESGNVTVRRNRILNNAALPGSSEGVIAGAPLRSLLLEQNLFEGQLDGSVTINGPVAVSIVDNRFDRRIRLIRTSYVLIQRNAGAGAATPDALIELAGGNQGTTLFDNDLAPGTLGRAILVSDSGGTGIQNSGLFVNRNCFATQGLAGLEVAPGTYGGTIDATSNWWGAADGPSGAGPGSGAAIVAGAGAVQFMPFRATSESCGCLVQPEGAACNDGNSCTGPDQCVSGWCTGATLVCDDANPCTDDSCDPTAGCVHVNNAAPCGEGTGCMSSNVCTGGVCSGAPMNCDDGNACTDDSCVELSGMCQHLPDDTNSCSDENPCTMDACVAGVCTSGGGGCDDGNTCTVDSCNGTSCTHAPVPDPGPNGSTICTAGAGTCARQGYCVGGQCSAQPQVCGTGNPCIAGSCRITGGCVYYPSIQVEEAGNLTFAADKVSFSWPPQVNACLPTSYDVASAVLTHLPAGSQPTADRCLPLAGTRLAQDALVPNANEGVWYLVRTRYFDQLTGSSLIGVYGTQRIDGVTSNRHSTPCP